MNYCPLSVSSWHLHVVLEASEVRPYFEEHVDRLSSATETAVINP